MGNRLMEEETMVCIGGLGCDQERTGRWLLKHDMSVCTYMTTSTFAHLGTPCHSLIWTSDGPHIFLARFRLFTAVVGDGGCGGGSGPR